jgi:2-desacetyl-2-hydroxyethyl bacteriochlorophyllide A dehydrogenase
VQEDDMRALVTRLRADNTREKALVTDWPEPEEPQGREIKTRTLYTGITNGTDHNHLVGGSYAHAVDELPACWGYQTVGRIIATGPGVHTLNVGDLLYMSADPMEYIVMPEDGLLVRLPETVEPTHAALFGMASVAMHACRTADLRLGERVLLVGQGCIGQIAAQIATVMGAQVTVCDIDPQRLEVARQVGAAEVLVNVADNGWSRHLADHTFDVVIDLAGVVGMEDALIRAVRHRGRLVLVAGRFEVRYTFSLGQGREITIRQPSHFDQDDLDNLCRLVGRARVQLHPLLRDIVPVTEAPRLYDRLRDAPSTLLGTVFDWQTR